MNDLSEIIQSDRNAIRQALTERLQRPELSAVSHLRVFDADYLLDSIVASVRQTEESAGQSWADALRGEVCGVIPSRKEIFAALEIVEQTLVFFIIKQAERKQTMLQATSEMSQALNRFRQRYLAAAEGSNLASQSNEQFRFLADHDQDFICLTRANGELFYLNSAGRQTLGLNETASASNVKLHELYDEDSWATFRDEGVPAVNKTGRWQGRLRLRNSQTGELTNVNATLTLMRSNEGSRGNTLAVVHRKTESASTDMEEALKEAQARKRSILESSLDPIVTVNHEGAIAEFNRAAEQAFGYPRSKIIGTRPTEILFPPGMDPKERDRIERYLCAGEGSLLGKRSELNAVRADGETFPVEMAMTISQEHGAPVMSFFVRDISERKKAEEAQQRYSAELERSNRELEQFAYVASHDLQEPLRKIRTFSDRLMVKQAERLDDDGRDCLQRMHNAAARMQSLIDGLLSLSRITTHGQHFVPVDLNAIAAEVISDLEEPIRRSEGRVETENLPTLQADPMQMRQLLQNLIANGLKFHRVDETPIVKVSGGYLRASGPGDPRREISECRIVVEDNGIGFEEKYADRIFGIFQRLHPRDVFEGTGIGLAICRRIAERHGGFIAAKSVPGRGSRFEITLPVRHKAKNESPEDSDDGAVT